MTTLSKILTNELPEHLRAFVANAQRQADVSIAASILAKLRNESKNRPRRIYTGRVGDRRAWRKMRVVLPDGKVGDLIMALRDLAFVTWRDEFALRPDQYGVFRTDELRRFKLPAAAILGAAKRGSKERVSERKARTSRLNGCRLPRPGSRPRGRPRSSPDALRATTLPGRVTRHVSST